MEPYSNLLAPATVIEEVMQSRGINNDSLVLIYDDNENMDSARLWWTLKIYGHDNVKVIRWRYAGPFECRLHRS
jgi:thiosulfate/3-mercaptopyruvate sulfurtransferase